MGKSRKKKKKTLEQMKEYLNDKSRIIKTVSREFFMGADIGTRRHKDKKKYSRKVKHKKRLGDE
jgi:Txe/YoeB family toxin of Txe-Axe toxin-antitoxin module